MIFSIEIIGGVFQSFHNRQPKSYLYEEALDVVCGIFEFGYTCPLYDLLDNDSTLVEQ
jgi:hypothetical protein